MNIFLNIYNFFLKIDRKINYLLGPRANNPYAGDENFTVSQVWGKYLEQDPYGHPSLCVICKFLTYIDNAIRYFFNLPYISNHCKDAIDFNNDSISTS
jgi:hypothetical protein